MHLFPERLSLISLQCEIYNKVLASSQNVDYVIIFFIHKLLFCRSQCLRSNSNFKIFLFLFALFVQMFCSGDTKEYCKSAVPSDWPVTAKNKIQSIVSQYLTEYVVYEYLQSQWHCLLLSISDWYYCILLYRQESNLAISSSPVTNNNVPLLLRCTATVWKNWKFLAVRRVWAWWPFASVVLTLRFPARY